MAITIEIDTAGLEKAMERLIPALDATVSQAMVYASDLVAEEARARAPVGKTSLAPGELQKSIRATPPTGSLSGGNLVVTVSAAAPHALHVEYGTDPHEIRPKANRASFGPNLSGYNSQNTPVGKRALRWGGGASGWIFAKKVNHPGTTAQPYMEPALEAKRSAVLTALEKGVRIAVARTKAGR